MLFIRNACIKNVFRSFVFLQCCYLNVQVLAENCRDGYGDGIDGRDGYADREGYGDTKYDGLIGASVKIISGRYKIPISVR